MSCRIRNLENKKFHNLTVINIASKNRNGSITWLCKCVCGKEVIFSSDHLTRKKSPIKSCGCKKALKGKYHKQWTGVGDISGNWWYSRIEREKRNVKRPKIPVTITMDYAWNLFIKQNRLCALSGIPISIGWGPEYNASIDRIDSSKGYEEGNVQWVDKNINFMKRTLTSEMFIELCGKVHIYNKENK